MLRFEPTHYLTLELCCCLPLFTALPSDEKISRVGELPDVATAPMPYRLARTEACVLRQTPTKSSPLPRYRIEQNSTHFASSVEATTVGSRPLNLPPRLLAR